MAAQPQPRRIRILFAVGIYRIRRVQLRHIPDHSVDHDLYPEGLLVIRILIIGAEGKQRIRIPRRLIHANAA
ncbi:hypothetical protein D3C76_1318230 [compost metagenome]